MEIKIVCFAWCKEGNHDKVWGVLTTSTSPAVKNYFTFWGRRGKSIRFKKTDGYSHYDLLEKKLDKGYRQLREHEINNCYPEFKSEVDNQLFTSLMADKVM